MVCGVGEDALDVGFVHREVDRAGRLQRVDQGLDRQACSARQLVEVAPGGAGSGVRTRRSACATACATASARSTVDEAV